MSKQKGFGLLPILAAGAALAILASLYFVWQERAQAPQQRQASDQPEAIEQDLEATSFTEVDSELLKIESELDAALQE